MKSAIAILTYRRLPVLQETLKGINQFCAHYPLAVFEDCGQRDGTSAFLTANRRLENRPIYAAAEAVPEVEATLSAEDALALKPQGIVGAQDVIALHDHLGAFFRQIVHEVIGEAIVIIDEQKHISILAYGPEVRN